MAIEIPTEVNIVALGGSAAYFNLFLDERGDDQFIISVNNSHDALEYRANLIIAMDDLQRDKTDHADYVDSIVNHGCPVLTTQHYPEWPSTEAYPLAEVVAWLMDGKKMNHLPQNTRVDSEMPQKLLNNTCNFALAYAAMMGARQINIWGFDWVLPDKKGTVQRQKNFLDKDKWPDWTIYYMEALVRAPQEPGLESCCYLLGLLNGRGIETQVPSNTTLLDHDRPNFYYGFQEQPEL